MRSISELSVLFALICVSKATTTVALPRVTLPYGIWQAAAYDTEDDVRMNFCDLAATDDFGSSIHSQISASALSPVDSRRLSRPSLFLTLRKCSVTTRTGRDASRSIIPLVKMPQHL